MPRPREDREEPQPGLTAPLRHAAVEPYIADARRFGRETDEKPDATVVIVAYNTNWELLRCLDSLGNQTHRGFETIVVDNGRNDSVYERLQDYPISYFKLRRNYRPSLARNVGSIHARAEVVCFLDDDALAHEDFVSAHLAAQQVAGILGAEGRVIPKTQNVYNLLAIHYDLGPRPFPCYVDLECNASLKREALLEVGGFDPRVFYGEGAELSHRLVRRFGDRESLVYWPDAMIYHDYGTKLWPFARKIVRATKNHLESCRRDPELAAFMNSYQPLPYASVPRPADLSMRLQYKAAFRLFPLLRRAATSYFQARL